MIFIHCSFCRSNALGGVEERELKYRKGQL